jgi:hypothetical protein
MFTGSPDGILVDLPINLDDVNSVTILFDNGGICEDSFTESLCCDSAFAHKEEFYIFKFPERFLEISCAEISLFSTSLFLTL